MAGLKIVSAIAAAVRDERAHADRSLAQRADQLLTEIKALRERIDLLSEEVVEILRRRRAGEE